MNHPLTLGSESGYALMRAMLSLSEDLDLDSVLQRFVDACTELTGARYGAINTLDATGTSTNFVQHGVADSVAARLANSPHAVGVLGEIPDVGVLRLDDLRDHPAFKGFPRAHPPMGSFLGTAVRVSEAVFGYLYLAEKDGGFVDDDIEVVTALAAAVAVAIHNAQLFADSRAREEWLRAGQEVTTMLLQGVDEEEALARIAQAARQIAGADTACLILPGMRGELVIEIVDGVGEDELIGQVMPRDGRTWDTMRGGAGMLVDSLHSSRVVRVKPLRQFGPALYAPLHASDHTVGVLLLLRRIGSAPFGPHDLLTARSFAAQAALALVLAEARHAQDAAALLDERERIARDLHDLAIQQLFATGMQLETVRRRAARGVDATELTGIVEEALDNVDSTVRQIRSIVHALKDPDATASLVERLRREASLARTGLGFAPSLVVALDDHAVGGDDEASQADLIDSRVRGDLADDVVAVVREGLANAARHASAMSVTVRVSVRGAGPTGTVHVEVEDDGTGVETHRERSSGTANLAARARQHRGTFTLGRAPNGRGTLLEWKAPLA